MFGPCGVPVWLVTLPCVVAFAPAASAQRDSRVPAAVTSLRVCADPNNLPFSNEKGEGFENRIAERLASDLGLPLRYTWKPQRRGFGLYLTGPDLHARWRGRQGLEPYAVPILPGCFLAMRRETFARTMGFDSGMRQLGGNDNELSCRFWLLGYELLVVPAIEVGHVFREKAPYEAKWAALVHNRLRMAFVHFEACRAATSKARSSWRRP